MCYCSLIMENKGGVHYIEMRWPSLSKQLEAGCVRYTSGGVAVACPITVLCSRPSIIQISLIRTTMLGMH